MSEHGDVESSEHTHTDSIMLDDAPIESKPSGGVEGFEASPEQWEATLAPLRYISFTYLALFTAFQTAQTLVIPLFPAVGSIGLGLAYLTFMISSLFSPLMVQKLGIKKCMVGSFFFYVAWIAATLPRNDILFLIANVGLGIAGGPVWVSHGMYMNALSQGRSAGRYIGTFLGFFFVCVLLGNLMIAILSAVLGGVSTSVLFLLLAIALLGVVMAFFVEIPDAYVPPPSVPILSQLGEIVRVAKMRRMRHLIPYLVWLGFGVSVSWTIPSLVLPSIDYVPTVFIAYGTTLFIGSNLFGRVYDRYGWHILMLINLFLAGVSYILFYWSEVGQFVVPSYFGGILLGAMEALFNCLSQATLLKYFRGDDSGPAFAVFRCVSSGGTAVAFMLFLKLGYIPMMLISGIGLVLAAFSWTYYAVFVDEL